MNGKYALRPDIGIKKGKWPKSSLPVTKRQERQQDVIPGKALLYL
jgi:hypothetical protein